MYFIVKISECVEYDVCRNLFLMEMVNIFDLRENNMQRVLGNVISFPLCN